MIIAPQTQVKSSLKTLVIQKDYRKGNFFAKKGTPLKGEVIIVPTLVPPSPSFLKVLTLQVQVGSSGTLEPVPEPEDILIPMEYFEETKTNTSAQANPTNPIIIYAAVAIGSILIYKYFIK